MTAETPDKMASERWWVPLHWYVALVAVTIGFLTYNFRLHHASLSVPLCPGHNDSVALLSLVKSIQESGWPWIVERVGAPGTAERFDYPLPEHAHYLLIRLLVWATGDPFFAFNLWCLLSYPLTAVCAFAVMRTLGLSRPIGFALAVLYAFLPYHASRVFTHTMLAYYHTVPLILLPIIWITIGRLPFFGPPDENGRRRWSLFNATTLWTVLLSAIIAVTSPYYAFFACFLVVVAGLYRGLTEGSWRPMLAGLATAAIVSGVGFASALPFVLEQAKQGANPAVAHRHANEADVYSLRVTKLVLPFSGHRVRAIGHITRLYDSETILPGERDAVLGLIGAIGFMVLLGRLLVARAGPTLLGGLAILNVAAVVLGATGGLGGLFNFLVFPQIRCYNRICVFIAFWCLLAVGLLIDRWAARGHSRRAWLVGASLLIFGLFDTTTQRQAPRYSEIEANHAAWSKFVERMEEAMPPGGMVFQLPATSYPEVGTTCRLPDYAHLACHPYSRTLRWSYGTCRNRRWDEWQQHVATLPSDQMIRALCLAGFHGLYVDRRGYADGAKKLLAELRELLGTELVVSDSGDQLLFTLAQATQRLRSSMDEKTWQYEKTRLVNRPCVLCQDGFLRWATVTPPEPRSATHSATMRLINPDSIPRQVKLTIVWEGRPGRHIDVHIVSDTLSIDRHESPPAKRSPLVIELNLSPGEHLLRFDSSPKPIGLRRMYTAWTTTEVRWETID